MNSRKPFVALLLALFPGLGQLYNGQWKKSIAFVLFDFLFPVAFGLSGVLLQLNGLVVMVIVAVVFFIYRLVDAFVVAKRSKEYLLKPFNKAYVYVLFVVFTIFLRFFIDAPVSTGIQTFKIHSPSMSPTLQPGDLVVVDLRAYRNTDITYGDIVVFNGPEGVPWTSRVIALPLDSIEVLEGKVYVNNQLNEIQKLDEYIQDNTEVVAFEERLSNHKKISTLRFKQAQDYSETRTFAKKAIPAGEYFLMGDSRDNAYDSRFLGAIKKEDIKGRIVYSYWGRSLDRVNLNFIDY